ncbi:hypothetical protein CoNPh17_CDS0017 [Staphylococcus phage S-CoN_Ph17]|nr:hypothetical protein CoNPh17_CDS0017 [Staphylococcus phage S-CoN_Ph17]
MLLLFCTVFCLLFKHEYLLTVYPFLFNIRYLKNCQLKIHIH